MSIYLTNKNQICPFAEKIVETGVTRNTNGEYVSAVTCCRGTSQCAVFGRALQCNLENPVGCLLNSVKSTDKQHRQTSFPFYQCSLDLGKQFLANPEKVVHKSRRGALVSREIEKFSRFQQDNQLLLCLVVQTLLNWTVSSWFKILKQLIVPSKFLPTLIQWSINLELVL